eukprot:CAMPEP_0170595178 /NCGR_PEP_ID=MMETSP0224-20130122/14413_1 /TAXON_ID=285029 /ORGANISM="Togula jolla, Strain CCCM 725" /LENGTH=80 /DNA_ID=CAMNT_0010919321 /DNA_START=150 /DNA_END=393 /DNA_ORIENTATION=+
MIRPHPADGLAPLADGYIRTTGAIAPGAQLKRAHDAWSNGLAPAAHRACRHIACHGPQPDFRHNHIRSNGLTPVPTNAAA